MNNWISVKERLPEMNVPVLVAYVGMDGIVHSDGVAALVFSDTSWYWWEGSVEDIEYEVSVEITHWMPLPEPPKEETP